jgi:hypothetical protein
LVLSIVVSTIVYFVASYLIRRKLDEMDIPKSMTRSITIFCAALIICYGAAAAVDWIFPGS